MNPKYPSIQEMIQKLQEAGRTPIVPAPNRWFADPVKHPFQQKMIERVLAQTKQGREGFPSGSYINPQTGEPMDFDIMHDLGVAIDPNTGRPMMSGIKSDLREINPKYGSVTKSNLVRKGLFKHEGGDELLKNLAFLATIEKSGKGHHYGLSTHYASPAELVNTMTGKNPTLRPHSRGDIFGVGDEVGRISIQGKHHPVYEKLLVAPAGSDVQGKKLHKAEGGVAHMDKGGRPPQQTNLDMAREAAERIGQHHDPLTRSLQQGYEHGWYHGSTGDIKAFDPNTRGESTGAASAKKGYFFARDPSTPPPEMLEHDPESMAFLQRVGATIPPKPTMAGHGAHTASSYAGTGGSREYKEAMRMAKAAERVGNWDAYEKYMQLAEDAEIKNMRYRQDLVAKHGDARDLMYEHIKNAWYGPHNAEMFKEMSQPDYEAHDKRYKELMPYGWHIDYEKPHYEMLKAQLQKFGNSKQVKSALDAINHYQSVHNERKAADVESGANVMPVALRYKNPMYHDFKGSSYRDQTYSDLMDQAMRGGHDALILKNTYDPGGTGKPKMVDVGVMFHPNQIRSKFAAFDPTRTKESDLLAKRGGKVTHAHHLEIEERPL
jgi:hypothetical protein